HVGAGSIDTGSPLDPNRAFADRLLDVFSGRSGDPASELTVLARLAERRGRGRLAGFVVRCTESLRVLVDTLAPVGRGGSARPADEVSGVRLLQRGGTEELWLSRMLASAEFGARAAQLVPAPSDPRTNYVEALHVLLLGRPPSPAELTLWLGRLRRLGRRGVALRLLTGREFRTDVVQALLAGNSGLPPDSVVHVVPD